MDASRAPRWEFDVIQPHLPVERISLKMAKFRTAVSGPKAACMFFHSFYLFDFMKRRFT